MINLYGRHERIPDGQVREMVGWLLWRIFQGRTRIKALDIVFDEEAEELKVWGYITFEDGAAEIILNPYSSPSILFKTLAHELQHLKQHLAGDLRYLGNKVLWKGKPYQKPNIHLLETAKQFRAYTSLPWEAEAIDVEKKMWKMWKSG